MSTSVAAQTLFGFSAYLVAVGTIAWFAYRHTHDRADYFLGSRGLPYWIAALSAGASDMSGWLLLGLPGLAFAAGSEAIWLALGLLVGTYLNWRFVASPLRTESERLGDALTLPAFFERRFEDRSGVIRICSALAILIFFALYTAAGFVAGGKLFASAFDLPYSIAVIVGATLVMLYTTFGGFLAVAWSDALQACVMIIALVFVAAAALLSEVTVAADQFALIFERSANDSIVIASSLAWGLGYFGQPHVLTRFIAIKSARAVAPARILATSWSALALAAALAVGLGAHVVFGPSGAPSDSETVFIVLTQQLLHPLLAGLCLAGILAAIMSTADSQLLIAASALTLDLNQRKTEKNEPLSAHRFSVVAICVLATFIALQPNRGVLELVAYAWAGFGATFGPVIIASLYLKDTHRTSVLFAMVTGALTVVVWSNSSGGWFDIYALLPGFLFSLAAIFVGNRFFSA